MLTVSVMVTSTEPLGPLMPTRLLQLGLLFGLAPLAISTWFMAAIKSLAELVIPQEPKPGVYLSK